MFLSFSSFDFYGSICLCFIFLSLIGLLINRLNILISLICIELMFYGANISLIIFSSILDDQFGSVATLFIVTVAASESAIALALLVRFFRGFNDIFLEEL
jgi:NADH-quinone oxidoreductase subunit K